MLIAFVEVQEGIELSLARAPDGIPVTPLTEEIAMAFQIDGVL